MSALDREIKLQGQIGNGDVLQALSMAIAVRARMLGGNTETWISWPAISSMLPSAQALPCRE